MIMKPVSPERRGVTKERIYLAVTFTFFPLFAFLNIFL